MVTELSHQVLLDRLQKSEDALRAKADSRRTLREELTAAVDIYLPAREQYLDIMAKIRFELGDDCPVEGSDDLSRPASRRSENLKAPDLSGLEVDFAGTTNLPERVLRIALAMDGKELNVSSVTRCLIAFGQYKTTVRNFRSNVNKVFTDQPEVYVKVSKGNFLYVGPGSPWEGVALDEVVALSGCQGSRFDVVGEGSMVMNGEVPLMTE